MLDELEMRKQKLKDRIASLNLEREETGKSMDSAEKSLQEIVGCTDWDTTRFFIEEDRNAHKEPEAIIQKQKADRQEVEDFYVAVSFSLSNVKLYFEKIKILDAVWFKYFNNLSYRNFESMFSTLIEWQDFKQNTNTFVLH